MQSMMVMLSILVIIPNSGHSRCKPWWLSAHSILLLNPRLSNIPGDYQPTAFGNVLTFSAHWLSQRKRKLQKKMHTFHQRHLQVAKWSSTLTRRRRYSETLRWMLCHANARALPESDHLRIATMLHLLDSLHPPGYYLTHPPEKISPYKKLNLTAQRNMLLPTMPHNLSGLPNMPCNVSEHFDSTKMTSYNFGKLMSAVQTSLHYSITLLFGTTNLRKACTTHVHKA